MLNEKFIRRGVRESKKGHRAENCLTRKLWEG